MKFIRLLIGVMVLAGTLLAGMNDFVGTYIFNNGRYVKTVVLKADASGAWTYHNNKSSAYDYDEIITWSYKPSDNSVVIELMTQNADGRIQSKGQKIILVPMGNTLKPEYSEEVFKAK